MLSENTSKIIRSLLHKKYRYKHNIFRVEGRKAILDMLLAGFDAIQQLYISQNALEEHEKIISKVRGKTTILSAKEFSKISNLDSAADMILIGYIPPPLVNLIGHFDQGIHLYLDQVQDPGNVGTILRTAEWFGISSVGLSEGTADIVHPKVVQASMGSFSRMPYWLGSLTDVILDPPGQVLGADLGGVPIYQNQWPQNGILVIGSEGQGISNPIKSKIEKYVHIPAFSPHIESLNAANAAAIILSEWRRNVSTQPFMPFK